NPLQSLLRSTRRKKTVSVRNTPVIKKSGREGPKTKSVREPKSAQPVIITAAESNGWMYSFSRRGFLLILCARIAKPTASKDKVSHWSVNTCPPGHRENAVRG